MKIPKGPGLFAATVGISAVLTAGFGWLEVLLGWLVAGMFRFLPENHDHGTKFSSVIVFGIGIVTLSGVVVASEMAFPKDDTFPAISLALYLLMYWVLKGNEKKGAVASNVIGLILALLIGVLLIFGIENIQLNELVPRGFSPLQTILTFAVASTWCWSRKEEDTKWFLAAGGFSVAISLVTKGILGEYLTQYSRVPFFEAVQTIRILGTLQRMEALLASGILLGTFAMMVLVGEKVYRAGKVLFPEKTESIWLLPALGISYGLEYLYFILEEGIKPAINTGFWVLALVLTLWIVLTRKMKNFENKA